MDPTDPGAQLGAQLDAAATAADQERLVAQIRWPGTPTVTRPQLRGVAVARLHSAGAAPAAVYACCADPDVLARAAYVAGLRYRRGEHRDGDPATWTAIAENPHTPMWSLWGLLDALGDQLGTCRRAADRVTIELTLLGDTSGFAQRAVDGTPMPTWLTSAVLDRHGLDLATLAALADSGAGTLRLGGSGAPGALLLAHPDLFATWTRTATARDITDLWAAHRLTGARLAELTSDAAVADALVEVIARDGADDPVAAAVLTADLHRTPRRQLPHRRAGYDPRRVTPTAPPHVHLTL